MGIVREGFGYFHGLCVGVLDGFKCQVRHFRIFSGSRVEGLEFEAMFLV